MDKIFFGVNIAQVGTLTKPGKIKKIPGSPEWIGGSVKYRNSVFPLVNFWSIMDLQKPQKKVLLLPSGFDYCAFLIAGVKGIYKIDTEGKSSYLYSLPYLRGFGVFQEKIVIQMELDKLLTEKQKRILKKVKNKNGKK